MKEICCSGMESRVKKGWIKIRAINPTTPNRKFFIVEIRGLKENMVLGYCPACGQSIYPTYYPRPKKDKQNDQARL